MLMILAYCPVTQKSICRSQIIYTNYCIARFPQKFLDIGNPKSNLFLFMLCSTFINILFLFLLQNIKHFLDLSQEGVGRERNIRNYEYKLQKLYTLFSLFILILWMHAKLRKSQDLRYKCYRKKIPNRTLLVQIIILVNLIYRKIIVFSKMAHQKLCGTTQLHLNTKWIYVALSSKRRKFILDHYISCQRFFSLSLY